MLEPVACSPASYGILVKLRGARRAFHATLTDEAGTRERVFATPQLLRTLKTHIERSDRRSATERCLRLFELTVLLYGALDWQFAGNGIDIEADVQLERMRQNHLHGGPPADDRLSAEDWLVRLRQQVSRLEQEAADEESYASRLVKLTALAQAALESACRRIELQ
ncbi:MAG TPA: hypothetical protein VHE32_13380 [Rhodanobacteraceae bacterium]|jgi:hypothetical protein|nr:hypothetical protein [Rhodanobacteraceae bacterium]